MVNLFIDYNYKQITMHFTPATNFYTSTTSTIPPLPSAIVSVAAAQPPPAALEASCRSHHLPAVADSQMT